ncbi:MAG: hypothetical protein V2G43_02765 [bacterium JZ-2024 1]
MRRWRELLEKWNGKREGVQNEAKGGNTGIDQGRRERGAILPNFQFFYMEEKKEVMV